MRTEDQFYEDHLADFIDTLVKRMVTLENLNTMTDQDEMELNALDRLLRDLESL